MARKNNLGPNDSVLRFKPSSLPNYEANPLNGNNGSFKAVRFSPLPVDGWNDRSGLLDFKCKQSCVKDCSCVRYCTLL